MLLEFSCSNFKSIRDKVVFSTVGTDDSKNEEFLRNFGDFRVLHTSVIYGPNGAGKSNLFKAIEFMKDLVLNSCENGEGQVLSQPRHKMAPKDEPSEFNMQFLMGDLRYAYGFVLCEGLVSEEYLYYFCGENVVEVFERVGGEVWLGDKFGENEVLLKIIDDKLGVNKLLLSCIGDNTDICEINDAFLFFKLHIVVQNMEMENNKEDCINAMMENEEMRQLIVSTFRELDSDIKDIRVEYPKVKVVYDEFETDLFEEESTGIKKLFYLVLPIVESFINAKVILVDEIEVSLHRNVAYEIIKLFNTSMPQSSAQLIFTSHDISFLSSNLFRKDQIWFAQLGKNRATDLYSLAEIKNVRADENIAKGYIMGKYGAIPTFRPKGGGDR
ncbi:AAA family ATPase [Intestinibacter bartlettii]|uniref:AAA family ATPase n=1 Tax=Intestinibacter bartlettii TaxID=261299 RepID=A0ABS6DZK0_9FIRM|nr:ATP-binding protein [Intestinibacter bartlettii]MBU5337275.1 AAA family ATPase [Intestinibacter bartlettii]